MATGKKTEISPIEPQDVPLLLRLIKKEFPYRQFSEEDFNERVLQPSVFVFKAAEGKKIAGFIDLEFLSQETGRITAISVMEELRGKKIGQKMLEFGIDFFKKQACRRITLIVGKENAAAKKLYEKNGFTKTKDLGKVGGIEAEEMELLL